MNATWVITKTPSGYRLTLEGANGEEIMRAMTIYNDKRDAVIAISLAEHARVIKYKDEQ